MIEYVLSIALVFLLWRTVVSSIVIHALSKEIANMKTQKDVEDQFVKANINTLYRRTERIPTANDPDIQKYMAIKVPFHLSLPSTSMYSPEQLKLLKKEYDKNWENFTSYKEGINK